MSLVSAGYVRAENSEVCSMIATFVYLTWFKMLVHGLFCLTSLINNLISVFFYF